jgi:hypothetical protein
MAKLQTKRANMLTQVYTLFFIMLVLLHTNCGCGPRPEENATENAKNELRKQLDNVPRQVQFKKILEAIDDKSKDDADNRKGYTEMALDIIDNHLKELDTDPNSVEHPLYLILTSIGALSGPNMPTTHTLKVYKHTRLQKYLKIFKRLQKRMQENGVKLSKDNTSLQHFFDEAHLNRKETLYYPLVALGVMNAKAKVYESTDTNLPNEIPILQWVLTNDYLNKKIQKKMVLALTNSPANTSAINKTFEVEKVAKNITPAMYIAFQARRAVEEAEADNIIAMFESCLENQEIKLLGSEPKPRETQVTLYGPDVKKLEHQPLLSFIIFNAVSTKVKLNDKWLAILDKALTSGDLKKKISSKDKEVILKYVKGYIDKVGLTPIDNAEEQNFSIATMYDQDKVKAVREKLEKYVGQTIPIGGKKGGKP